MLSSLCACYSTGYVAPQTLRQLGSGLKGPRELQAADGGSVLLDTDAMVRGHLADGGTTPWFKAAGLSVTPEGLILGAGLPMSEVAVAMVLGLDARELEILRESAPPGGTLTRPWRLGGAYELKAAQGQRLDWARRFASRALSEGKAGGTWHLERAAGVGERVLGTGYLVEAVVDAKRLLDSAASPTATLAPGLRWENLGPLELRYFDPTSSALVVPLFPFVLLWGWLDSDGVNRAMSQPAGADGGGPFLVTWAEPPREAQRLFTARARRRAMVRLLGTGEIGATLKGDLATGGTLGVRIGNFLEFALVGRALSLPGLERDGGRGTRLVAGPGLGMNVDGDGDPRFSFYLGADIVGRRGQDAVTAFTFRWGPRFVGSARRSFLLFHRSTS